MKTGSDRSSRRGRVRVWEEGYRVIVETVEQVELWTATDTQEQAEEVAREKLDELAGRGEVGRAQVLTTEGVLVWESGGRGLN